MQTVGLYTDAQTVLQKPGYFSRLQQELGLNLVIIGYGGELPGSVLAQTPFVGEPPTIESISAVLTPPGWHPLQRQAGTGVGFSGTACGAWWR
jgi:hypothetical protein